MGPSHIRAFFALDLPLEHKRHLAETVDALKLYLEKEYRPSQFRWVRPQGLHITLQFMGQAEVDGLATLLQQVRKHIHHLKPFYLRLGSLEWFPCSELPHVLSLSTEPHQNLAEFSQALGKGLEASGFALEKRSFRGHLTLCRVAGLRNVDPEYLRAFAWPRLPEVFVKEVVLFKSEPQKGGSLYTRLASLELSEEPGG